MNMLRLQMANDDTKSVTLEMGDEKSMRSG